MKYLVVVVAVLAIVGTPLVASESDSMQVGDLSIELGLQSQKLRSQLPPSLKLKWDRRAPRTDPDQSANIVKRDQGSTPLVALQFHGDQLTRATRQVGPDDLNSAQATTLADAIVSTLSTWTSTSNDQITVSVSDLHQNGEQLRELTFTQGARHLTLVESEEVTYLIENLGRGDTPVVTSTP